MRGTRRHRGRTGRRSRIFGPVFATIVMVCIVFFTLERTGVLPEPVAVAVRQIEHWLTPILSELGIELPTQTDRMPPVTIEADDRVAVTDALELFDRIVVEPKRNTGYNREDWSHWLDLSGNCMSTRHEVLVAESIVPPEMSTDGCTVSRGLWYDAYTGETFSNPRDLDIDHFIPLAEAHRSGGYAWDHERGFRLPTI